MKVLRSAWLSILYFIRTIILTVVAGVIVLGALCGYLSLQPFMFCKGDYLLFVGGDLNMIPAIMIIILIIFVLFRIKERFFNRKEKEADIINENDEPLDIKDLNKLEKFFFKLLNVFLANNKEKEADIIDENDKLYYYNGMIDPKKPK